MSLIKDLHYSKDNGHLEIARLCSLTSVICFWGGVFFSVYRGGDFDPIAVGTGCAAIFAGAAGWIYWRQKHENGDG